MIEQMKEHLAAYASGDWSTYRSGFADDAEYVEVATNRRAHGPEQITALVKSWKEAFSDLSATIEESFEVEDKLFAELRWEGTHDGKLDSPLGPIEASGERGTTHAALFVVVRDGKITKMHHYFDVLTVLRQVGAMERFGLGAAGERAAE